MVEASGIAEPDRVAAYGDRRRLRPDGIVRPFDESHPSGPGVRSNFLHPVFRCERITRFLLLVAAGSLC